MRVAKWGNSLAIRIPASVANALDLKEGAEVVVRIAAPGELEIAVDRTRQEAIEKIRSLRRPLPLGFRFDREEANAR